MPYFVNIFESLLLHMLEVKTYKSTVVIELKQKNYQAELCKLIVWIAAYKMSQGNAAYSLLSSAFLNRNADTDNVRSAPLLNRLEVYLFRHLCRQYRVEFDADDNG